MDAEVGYFFLGAFSYKQVYSALKMLVRSLALHSFGYFRMMLDQFRWRIQGLIVIRNLMQTDQPNTEVVVVVVVVAVLVVAEGGSILVADLLG